MSDMPPDPFSNEDHEDLLEPVRNTECEYGETCALNDPLALATAVLPGLIGALGDLLTIASELYAHGEELLAETLTVALGEIGGEMFKTYFQRVGLVPTDED